MIDLDMSRYEPALITPSGLLCVLLLVITIASAAYYD